MCWRISEICVSASRSSIRSFPASNNPVPGIYTSIVLHCKVLVQKEALDMNSVAIDAGGRARLVCAFPDLQFLKSERDMAQSSVVLDSLRGDIGFLNMTLGDLSDADLVQRPVPGANNALWQLGHLIASEASMVNSIAGRTVIEVPAGFAERFKKATASLDDPAKLGTKADLLALFAKARGATVDWAASLTEADMAKESPENLRDFAPTVAHFLNMLPAHVAMHIGQFQVLRRKLGKPVLF